MSIPTRFGSVRAVVFDLDGTLVDSILSALGRLKRIIEEHGVPYTPEMDAYLNSHGSFIWIPCLTEEFGVEPALAKRIHDAWEVSCTAETTPLFDGVLETLDWLHERDVLTFILTARFRESTMVLLRSLEIHERFVEIVTHDDVENPKPHADAFVPILNRLREHGIAESECLFVGDTPTDLLTGRSAGIRTVIVRSGDFSHFEPHHDLVDDHVIASVKELREWLHLKAAAA